MVMHLSLQPIPISTSMSQSGGLAACVTFSTQCLVGHPWVTYSHQVVRSPCSGPCTDDRQQNACACNVWTGLQAVDHWPGTLKVPPDLKGSHAWSSLSRTASKRGGSSTSNCMRTPVRGCVRDKLTAQRHNREVSTSSRSALTGCFRSPSSRIHTVHTRHCAC